jgi:hypothetical protein
VVVDHFPAERFDEDARDAKTREAIFDRIHNETYVLASTLLGRRRWAAILFGFLIGSRSAPGVIGGLFVSRGPAALGRASPSMSFRARRAGLATWRSGIRS